MAIQEGKLFLISNKIHQRIFVSSTTRKKR